MNDDESNAPGRTCIILVLLQESRPVSDRRWFNRMMDRGQGIYNYSTNKMSPTHTVTRSYVPFLSSWHHGLNPGNWGLPRKCPGMTPVSLTSSLYDKAYYYCQHSPWSQVVTPVEHHTTPRIRGGETRTRTLHIRFTFNPSQVNQRRRRHIIVIPLGYRNETSASIIPSLFSNIKYSHSNMSE